MTVPHQPDYLRELLLFLGLAGILVPLLQRWRVNQVLGFLAVGAALGPYALGSLATWWPEAASFSFQRQDDVAIFGELGVMFLMFAIGLELSLDRLWAMRRWVFGAGALQVVASAAAIGALALAFGNAAGPAVVLGLVLAFSSTAVVMHLLTERRELGTPLGRAAFAVLLFQDLAVVPALLLVDVLGQAGARGISLELSTTVLLVLGKALLAVALIFAFGRLVMQPVFRYFGARRQADSFMALVLLSTLGTAVITAAAGLSMALGAFLAGLLLAETEYRHEVEIAVEPFRGLLMGVFFMSVGMGIDLGALLREPLWLPLSVAGLMLLKAVLASGALRLLGLPTPRAVEAGLLLSQGGEFAFVVVGAAMANGLLDTAIGQFMLLVVALSMVATPAAARLGRGCGSWLARRRRPEPMDEPQAVADLESHVVIAGFGRVGQLLAQLLAARGVPYVALEVDAARVAHLRQRGEPVFVGDAGRVDLLQRLHVDRACAVVLTMDQPGPALQAAQALRGRFPELPVITRARDDEHARALREAGAAIVVLETLESGLQLAAHALGCAGMPAEETAELVEHERARRQGRSTAG